MTRKQAILRAIEILSADEKNKEICEQLKNIYDDMPLCRWSEKAIFDAFDQYILEHGYIPSHTELNRNPNVPTHSSIKNRFGITTEAFLQKYYSEYFHKCKSRIYNRRSVEYWKEYFTLQYKKLGYPTLREYDKNREDKSPSGNHLVKICGYKTWNDLVYGCGYDVLKRTNGDKYRTQYNKINAISIRNNNIEHEDVDAINQKLQDLL
jgi:hypothetical protein